MSSIEDQAQCHELRVIATNGRVFRVAYDTVWTIVTSRLYLWMLVLFSIMVALFNAPMFDVQMSLVGRFVYWLFDCIIVSLLWVGAFRLILWSSAVLGRTVPALSFGITLFSVGSMVWLNYVIAVWINGIQGLSAVQVWIEVLRYSAIATVFEILAVVFLLPQFKEVRFEGPQIQAPIQVNAPKAEPEVGVSQAPLDFETECEPKELRVNGRSYNVEALVYLKSIEHYVEIATRNGAELERIPLKDLTRQLDETDGCQTHRSWWVARNAVDRLLRRDGAVFVVLTNGTEVPVSRGRKVATIDWLSQNGIQNQ